VHARDALVELNVALLTMMEYRYILCRQAKEVRWVQKKKWHGRAWPRP
jgi:hypothetical protein